MPAPLRQVLSVPLAWKLAGANVLVALVALGVEAWRHLPGDRWSPAVSVSLAISAAMIVNFVLVRTALQPLRELEATVARVAFGDFDARVAPSPFADRDLSRIAAMVNALLDTVSGDRARIRLLASRVIDAGDRQRAEVAHALHDSTAQTLAGLAMQISVAAHDEADPSRADRLTSVKETLTSVTEDVRQIAQEMHPRVLEDLGLPAALRELSRHVAIEHDVDIVVDAVCAKEQIPFATASGLYRVVEEALTNALRHGNPAHIDVRLFADDEGVVLQVVDDGKGFAVEDFTESGPGSGLFFMRERLSVVNGSCHIRSAPGKGTRVIARVPFANSVNCLLAGASHEP